MPINILMPALSPTMESGTLSKWYVKEGDKISAGEILAEIETDKATMEFEAIEDGHITKILVSEGSQNIPINSVIAEITLEDEAVNTDLNQLTAMKPMEQTAPIFNNNVSHKTLGTDQSKPLSQHRIKISPLAKKIASNHNISFENIKGSGPHGRIIKKDLMQVLDVKNLNNEESLITEGNQEQNNELRNRTNPTDVTTINDIFLGREYEVVPISGVRKIIASRLTEAKRTIPHFYLRRSIEIDRLVKLRAELNESFLDKETKFTINDFIIKAAAKSLQDNPKCNSIWGESKLIQLKNSDIAVAVAIDDGLLTPIIRDAEKKSLQDISIEMKEKAHRAKIKKLLPEEYTGGSFSISNLGMMGVENFDAVINPPQASILAVGAIIQKPVVGSAGDIYVGQVLSVTLSADHRVIDGAVGALFLGSIADYLSNPLKLLI